MFLLLDGSEPQVAQFVTNRCHTSFRVWLPNPEAPMSLKPTPIGPAPELTSYVARAAFPDGNPYLA
jgi:hypothetical protein